MHQPQSTGIIITDLPPELLAPICSYLGLEDLIRVVRTCKYIRAVVLDHHLPRAISERAQLLFKNCPVYCQSCPGGVSIKDQCYHEAPINFTCQITPKFKGTSGMLRESIEAELSILYFTAAVQDQLLKTERAHSSIVAHLEFLSKYVYTRGRFPCSYGKLLLAIKFYSCSCPADVFSIESIVAEIPPLLVTKYFDLQKLKKIKLTFRIWWYKSLETGSIWMRMIADDPVFTSANCVWDPDKGMYLSPVRGEPLADALDAIADLEELFKQALNLEDISLHVKVQNQTIQPLSTLSSPLKSLSDAMMGLKKLLSLHLETHILHPAFFLPVPASVKCLSLSNVEGYSKAWWKQFAKFPFQNVEELTLQYATENRLCNGVDTDNMPRELHEIENMGFELGDVEIQGLKLFKFHDTHRFYLPRDLIPCILRKNPGLEEQGKKSLAESYGKTTAMICKGRLEKVVNRC
ncbi:hypothetical protein TWF281_008227 [Arthrobotrys megalospora]